MPGPAISASTSARRGAQGSQQGQDGEVAGLNHSAGLDLPNGSNADASQHCKLLLSNPGGLPELAQQTGQPGSLHGIPAISPPALMPGKVSIPDPIAKRDC
jgi:hypothetical protein